MSEVEVPLFVKARLVPLSAVGRAMRCTSWPPSVYSATKTGVAAEVRAAEPSPTTATATLPGVKATGEVVVGVVAGGVVVPVETGAFTCW